MCANLKLMHQFVVVWQRARGGGPISSDGSIQESGPFETQATMTQIANLHILIEEKICNRLILLWNRCDDVKCVKQLEKETVQAQRQDTVSLTSVVIL